jgi:orotate phosphoribosyltransferase
VTRKDLLKRIKETAYLEGDFVLRSGKRSKYYLDKYLFETWPKLSFELRQAIVKMVL